MENLRDKIAREVDNQISSLTLKPGTIIVEKEIAEQFQVSKTPVREALVVLAQRGLVRPLPRKGYMVTHISMADVDDCFDLRLILEGAAAERAAKNLTEEDLEELERLSEYDKCDCNEVVSMTERMDHSLHFHLIIARGARNSRLVKLIETTLREMRRITALGFVYGEHAQVIKYLRERDPISARREMENHVLSGKRAALENARTILDFA